MDLIYCDHYEVQKGGSLFGIGAVRVSANSLHDIRLDFYSKLNLIVPFVEATEDETRISEAPMLHGSDLLETHSDEIKVKAVRVLMDVFAAHGGRFFVVDYHAKSLFKTENKNKMAQGLNEMNMLQCAPREEIFALIVEQQDARICDAFAMITPMSYAYSSETHSDHNSYDTSRHVGTFVGRKSELGLQAADIAGYLWQCKQRPDSKFRAELAVVFDEFEHLYLLKERIFMKRHEAQA